jgi:hypothetical protein
MPCNGEGIEQSLGWLLTQVSWKVFEAVTRNQDDNVVERHGLNDLWRRSHCVARRRQCRMLTAPRLKWSRFRFASFEDFQEFLGTSGQRRLSDDTPEALWT